MNKILILIVVLLSIRASLAQNLNSTIIDSSKYFWLLEPEDNIATRHRLLPFTWSMPEYNIGRTLSYEYRWSKPGVFTLHAHSGFDTTAHHWPYLRGDGLYYWNILFHEGGVVILNNPDAVTSRNGPFYVIIDTKPADVAFSPIEAVKMEQDNILAIGIISDEELDTTLTKGRAAIADSFYTLSMSQNYPPLTLYTISLDLSLLNFTGMEIIELELIPFDLVKNVSDTLNTKLTIAIADPRRVVSIYSPDSLFNLHTIPDFRSIIVLWPELTNYSNTNEFGHILKLRPETPLLEKKQSLLRKDETIIQYHPPIKKLERIKFVEEHLPYSSFLINTPITVLTTENYDFKNSTISWKYDLEVVRTQFDSIFGGDNAAFDERMIGLYQFNPYQTIWQYIDGEGGAGILESKVVTDGRLGLLYNIEHEPVPDAYELAQNYPNPFNNVTNIRFELPQDSHVILLIYNILGQRIATLVNEFKMKGRYVVTWNGRDENERSVSSGQYLYRIEMGSFVQTKQMLLVK